MSRTQWTLLGLLLVQLALITVLRSPASSATDGPGKLVDEFDATQIARIEVGTKPSDTLHLERKGSIWGISSADGYPADDAKVRKLLDAVGNAEVRSPVVTSSKYHESLDVTDDKARARVRFFAGSDESMLDLLIGSTTSGGAHVRRSGEDEVFEVTGLSPWELNPAVSGWMNKKLVDVPTDEVVSLRVTNQKESFEFARTGEGWTVVGPNSAAGKPGNTEKVEAIVRAAASFNVADSAGPIDVARHGFGDDATVVTLRHGEGSSVTIRIGNEVPDKSSQRYVTRDGFEFAATQWTTSLQAITDASLDELLELAN